MPASMSSATGTSATSPCPPSSPRASCGRTSRRTGRPPPSSSSARSAALRARTSPRASPVTCSFKSRMRSCVPARDQEGKVLRLDYLGRHIAEAPRGVPRTSPCVRRQVRPRRAPRRDCGSGSRALRTLVVKDHGAAEVTRAARADALDTVSFRRKRKCRN